MPDRFSEFTQKISGLDRPERLRDAMARVSADLGFESFMFLRVDERSGEQLLISNYPQEWIDHYVEEDYAHADPVAREASQTVGSFTWGPAEVVAPADRAGERVFDEAGSMGIRQGLCVVWGNGPAGYSGISFTTARPSGEFHDLVRLHRADLDLIGLYFCSYVDNRIVAPGARPEANPLTPREKDYLQWAVEGHTIPEIAARVMEAEDRVVQALRTAMHKLGADTLAHAAAKAVELGLIYA